MVKVRVRLTTSITQFIPQISHLYGITTNTEEIPPPPIVFAAISIMEL